MIDKPLAYKKDDYLEDLSDIDTDIDFNFIDDIEFNFNDVEIDDININLDDMQEDLITELNDLQDLDFNIDD